MQDSCWRCAAQPSCCTMPDLDQVSFLANGLEVFHKGFLIDGFLRKTCLGYVHILRLGLCLKTIDLNNSIRVSILLFASICLFPFDFGELCQFRDTLIFFEMKFNFPESLQCFKSHGSTLLISPRCTHVFSMGDFWKRRVLFHQILESHGSSQTVLYLDVH